MDVKNRRKTAAYFCGHKLKFFSQIKMDVQIIDA